MRAQGVRVGASLAAWLLAAAAVQGQTLEGVDVRSAGDASRVILDVKGPVTQRSFALSNPDRIVVDLVGVTKGVRAATWSVAEGPIERLRVSQFARQPQPVVRVVADLRHKVRFEVQIENGDLVLVVGQVEHAAAPAESAATTPPATVAAEVASAATPSDAVVADSANCADSTRAALGSPEAAPSAESEVAAAAVPVASETGVGPETTAASVPAATPDTALAAPRACARTRASGEDTAPKAPQAVLEPTAARRINLDVQGADIHTVLRTLADYSGKNIIASREVEGTVSARLYDTPWEDALATILKAHGYGYVEEHGILRVGVMQKIRNEELEEAAAARKREDLLPIETRVVRMQFADAAELKPALSDMLSQRGKIQVDARTNSIIISDIPDLVAKISTMSVDLDSRTPQVEIVSKLVDVSMDDSKDLGIKWDALNLKPSGANLLGQAGVHAPTTGAVGSLRLGVVQSWGQLDAMIDALAKSKRANIVSNPNITTVNNREAKILVGAKIPLIVADAAGNAITQLTTVGIQMKVTPHVNSDKTITMDLHPEVSELSSQATVQGGVIIQTSEADTRVLVDNGETAIIGGLVRNVTSDVRTGIPILQDLPLLGALFRNTSKTSDKRELIIFVTPKIIEPLAASKAPGVQN